MGIESLENAARAAGFAMATDEPVMSAQADNPPYSDPWRPSAVPVEGADGKESASFTEWVKGVVGAGGGRSAPA